MNESVLKPQPYDKLLHKALECLSAAAVALRDGNTKLVAAKQDEANSLMISYDLVYGYSRKENLGGT